MVVGAVLWVLRECACAGGGGGGSGKERAGSISACAIG